MAVNGKDILARYFLAPLLLDFRLGKNMVDKNMNSTGILYCFT